MMADFTNTHKLITILLLLPFGCTEPQPEKTNRENVIIEIVDTNKTEMAINIGIIETDDTLIIKGPSAVLYHPDSMKIISLKKKYDNDEDFYTIADDNLWYIAQSREFLRSQGLKVIDTEKNKIVFIKSDGEKTTFNTDTLESSWGGMLFNGTDEPKEVDIVDIEEEYKKYFK